MLAVGNVKGNPGAMPSDPIIFRTIGQHVIDLAAACRVVVALGKHEEQIPPGSSDGSRFKQPPHSFFGLMNHLA